MADFEKVYAIKFNTRKAQTALKGLDKQLATIEHQSKDIGKSFEKFVGGKGVRATEKLNKSLKVTRRRFEGLDKKLQNFGRNMRRYVTLPLAAAGLVSMKFARDLNKSMANVSTLLTGGREQIEGYKRAVQSLAVGTGLGTGDLSGGLYQVVSALGESRENIEQLGVAARASVAGLAETNDTILMLAASGKAYGDVSKQALKHTSDLAFTTVKLGVTTFPELAASMGKVLPLAAAMNTRQEELYGTMATLTGVTGDTAEVTTQIASVYSAMLKPTGALTTIVKKLGYESSGTMMKELGFRKTLLALSDAVDGNESKLAKLLKRKEALVAVLALLGGQSETYEKKLKAMEGAAGATDEAYRKQTEGINKQGHEWEKTKQRMVVFSQRIGDKLLPVLGRLLKAVEPVLERIEKMDDATLEAGLKFAGMALAIGPVVGMLAKMSGSIGMMAASKGALAGTAGVLGKMMTSMNVALVAGGVGAALLKLLEYKAGKHAGKVETYEESGLSAKRVARSKVTPLSEKREYLSKLKTQHSQFQKERTPIYEIPQAVGALLSGGETPAQSFRRRRAAGAAGIQALESEIQGREMSSWLYRGSTSQADAPTVNIGDTNITIEGRGKSDQQLTRDIERAVKKTLTKEARDISRMSHQLVPAQQ